MKDSYPVPVTDDDVSNNLQNESAFVWWVPYVIKKRKAIIVKIKSKYWQQTHKYGLRVTKPVAEAIQMHNGNGDTLWQNSIKLEMKNDRVAFTIYGMDIKKLQIT